MVNTLNTYANLQYEPIPIPAYTILEIYKETIAKSNSLGYCILPIGGLSNAEIKAALTEKAALAPHEEYTNCKILAGRAAESYDHRIVYAVWYNGDVEPEYPEEPEVSPQGAPGEAANIWYTTERSNNTYPMAFLNIDIVCSSFDEPIEFYINDNYYYILITNPIEGDNHVYVNQSGVQYHGAPVETFEMKAPPYNDQFTMTIKLKATNITSFTYTEERKY